MCLLAFAYGINAGNKLMALFVHINIKLLVLLKVFYENVQTEVKACNLVEPIQPLLLVLNVPTKRGG